MASPFNVGLVDEIKHLFKDPCRYWMGHSIKNQHGYRNCQTMTNILISVQIPCKNKKQKQKLKQKTFYIAFVFVFVVVKGN